MEDTWKNNAAVLQITRVLTRWRRVGALLDSEVNFINCFGDVLVFRDW